ncbi:histidine phosphatase family protein [uncultured Croceitalea sp.]|uniref:SixA phosphatase family protein n=1 Tax=uncultured Croceitalea sp. TaxID=1798908 RepID=UPI003305EA36
MNNTALPKISYRVKTILITAICVGFFNCNTKDKEINKEPIISTFYLIRHAEKDRTDSTNRDPELMQKGLDRAIRWAEVFDNVPLDAIYSTDYQRTKMTAAPTSVKKDLTTQFYDPSNIDVDTFKSDHEGMNVLVVGHSNTTPDFVNKLIGQEKYDAIDDADNTSLFIVKIVDSVATDIRLKIL